MRTALGRVTGHTGTPTAIRVPVVPVYASTAPRQEHPVPEHRQPPERGRTIAMLLIWIAVLAMFGAAALLLRAAMSEPITTGDRPGMYVSTIGYPPSP